jgi:hypothetical protein
MVNNKKLRFGDEVSSCSDVAMTEQFYMQIQVLHIWLRLCNNYSLPRTGVGLDLSHVTGQRDPASQWREFLSEVRKQPSFYKNIRKENIRTFLNEYWRFSYVFIAEQATFCATFVNPRLWETQPVSSLWSLLSDVVLCLPSSVEKKTKFSVKQN